MAYVITQNCCKNASCVPVYPVDGPGEFTRRTPTPGNKCVVFRFG